MLPVAVRPGHVREEWYDSEERSAYVPETRTGRLPSRPRRFPRPDPASPAAVSLFSKNHDIMGAASMLVLLLTHPIEFRTLLQYKIWHEPKRDITQPSEHATSGWDRPTMRRCWEFLDLTSRSFSGVIKELDGELARVVRLLPCVLLVRVTTRWPLRETESRDEGVFSLDSS